MAAGSRQDVDAQKIQLSSALQAASTDSVCDERLSLGTRQSGKEEVRYSKARLNERPQTRGPRHNAATQARNPGLRTSDGVSLGITRPDDHLLTSAGLAPLWALALALRCRREQRSCFRLAPRAILQCRGGTDGISVAFGLPKAATTF